MKAKADKARLAILVQPELSANFGERYYHIRCIVRQYRPDDYGAKERDGWSAPDDTYHPVNGWADLGFTIGCQGDESSRAAADTRDDRGVYGWDVTYRELHTVDLRRARKVCDTLAKLDRKMEKLCESRGRPHTFGEYVARVAEAIGAKTILFENTSKYNPARYIAEERIGDAIGRIDRMIYVWSHTDKKEVAS